MRILARCQECNFAWSSSEAEIRRTVEVHTAGHWRPAGKASVVIALVPVRGLGFNPRRSCREAEPPQVPPPSTKMELGGGACSWSCRGSFSPDCYCACGGATHALTSHWDPGANFGTSAVIAIYDQLARAVPRGDWKGRKST